VKRLWLLAPAAVLVALLLVLGLGHWSNHSQNGQTIPPDDVSRPTGPSTVIRGIVKRAADRRARERREQALDVERILRGDPPPDAGD
jgi:hypothetical protein